MPCEQAQVGSNIKERPIETYYLNTPLRIKDIRDIRSGDRVFISGKIYAMRDEAHKRFIYKLIKKEKLPFDPRGQVIYYTGPAPAPEGVPIGPAGPTSSYRMDPFTPQLLDIGIRAAVGKGPRDGKVRAHFVKKKAVYLVAVGGAAALLARTVVSSKVIAFEELGPEAVRELEVKDFPCIAAYDIHGNDIFTEGIEKWKN